MRIRFTIILIFLNILAFGALFTLNQKADKAAQSGNTLATIIGKEVAEAERIELWGNALEATRVLERSGSTWKMTAPMEWSANFFAVNRILNQLQFLEEEASFTIAEIEKTGQSLADYGLENPALTLKISGDNSDIVLSIGSITEIGNNVYILGPNEEEIYVVSGQSLKSLLIDLNDLRTRDIFDIPVFEVKGMTVQIRPPETSDSIGLKVRLAKTNDLWTFEAPLNAQANPAIVSDTISTLTAAKVVRFIEPEALQTLDTGLENPFMRVTIDGNKRRQTLLIGNLIKKENADDSYYAKLENNPTVFTVVAKPFVELQKAQEALRERNFMNFEKDKVSAIILSEQGIQTRLQKIETGEWQVIESKSSEDVQPYRADSAIMDSLIDHLKQLRATQFAVDAPTQSDLQRLGFNNPRRTVKLTTGDKSELILQLAHPEDENEKLYAQVSSGDYIYQVDRRSTLNMLPLSSLAYRNRTLDALPEAARINAIKLTNLLTNEVIFEYALGSSDALWSNVLTDLPAKEQAAILQLIDSIRQFKVSGYVANQYSPSYQLDADKTLPWNYALEAKILLPGGETMREDNRRYVFSERLSGTLQIGASESMNTTFKASQQTLDALYELTENMALPPEAESKPVPSPELPEAIEAIPAENAP